MFSFVEFIVRLLRKYITRFFPTCLLKSFKGRFAHLLPNNRKWVTHTYLGDVSMNIDTTYMIERLAAGGMWEPLTFKVIQSHCKPGNACIDIGANVGAITFQLAKAVGSTGLVLAVEPGPFLFERLRENLLLNPSFTQIKALRIGASSERQTLYWSEDMSNRGNAGLSPNYSMHSIAVDVLSLDEIWMANRLPQKKLGFLKIDVEGMEIAVLKGGGGILARDRPLIWFETLLAFEQVFPNCIKNCESYLKSKNYKLFAVASNGRIEREVFYPNLPTETLAIPDEIEINSLYKVPR